MVSPGRTLRYEGRETTSRNGLLFHRACASTWHRFLLFCKKHQQNNNFARSSQFFVHFFPFLHDYDVKKSALFCFFLCLTVNQARRNFILFRVWIWSLGIHFEFCSPTFDRKRANSQRARVACEQALLFGRVKRVSRESASERRSPNRRACSQARACVKAAVVSSSKCARTFNNLLFNRFLLACVQTSPISLVRVQQRK